jgi:hypothetical protein
MRQQVPSGHLISLLLLLLLLFHEARALLMRGRSAGPGCAIRGAMQRGKIDRSGRIRTRRLLPTLAVENEEKRSQARERRGREEE